MVGGQGAVPCTTLLIMSHSHQPSHTPLVTSSSGPATQHMATPSSGTSHTPFRLEAPERMVSLLLPHVAVALLILVLLFADFLAYRRRTRLLQDRVQEKQELMQCFPRRVIAGVFRNLPSVSASSLPRGSHHGTDTEEDPEVARKKTSSSDTPSSSSLPEDGPTPHRTSKHKKKHRFLESINRLKADPSFGTVPAEVTTTESPDTDSASAATADSHAAAKRSRRRLQKRETCRKLPPIPIGEIATVNGGVVHKEVSSPLADDDGTQQLIMA